MRQSLGLVIVLFLFLHIILWIPSAISEDSDITWMEEISISGSCSTEYVRKHITVNETVVEIIVNLTWVVNGTGANLDMFIEHSEGYVVNASDSEEMPEVMSVREFPNRGRWTFVVVPTSCGSSGEAFYKANISMRNVVLPKLEVSATDVDSGENVTFKLSSTYENASQYFFDYGDGTDSGWVEHSSVSKEYENGGEYNPRAKVGYSDGTESDWVESGVIQVRAASEDVDVLLEAQLTLIILIIMSSLIYIIIKKRKKI
jgi:hypothetical protein